MQGGFQGEDFVGQIKTWFNNCPLFTKGTIYICSSIVLLNMITNISLLFVNYPEEIIPGFQLHRLILSPFSFLGILEALFGFFAFLPHCARQEKEWGTVKTIVDFFWKNTFINVLYIIFGYLLYPLTDIFVSKVPCYGLWQVFFAFIMERSMQNPEGISTLLCLPIQIKTKYYPIALWLLFSLISGFPRVDNLIALLVGYIHFAYLNDKYFAFLSDTRIAAWSGSFFFNWLKDQPNYVSVSGVQSSGTTAPGPVIGRVASNNAPNNQPQSGGPFSAFGGKGVSIGGDEENPVPKKPNNYVALHDDISDLEISENREEGH